MLPIPVPEPTPVSLPFWEGLRQRTVRVQYSPSSDRYVFYPRVVAPGTLADDLEWRDISGLGVLYSFAVASHRPTAPPWANSLPQILAIVEWDEGARFSTELVNVNVLELRVGMRVRPVYVDVEGHDITLLKYTIDENQDGA